MRVHRKWIALNLLLATLLACSLPGLQGSPRPPATFTAEALVVLQPSAAASGTSGPETTGTPFPGIAAGAAPTPAVPQARVTSPVDCLAGPDTLYSPLYTLQPGQSAEVIGRDAAGAYWVVRVPSGGICWLPGEYAVIRGNVSALPEHAPPPSPTPFPPADPTGLRVGYRCTVSLSPFPHNEVHVEISWKDNASNEDGYYVLRDGRLLAALARDTTHFADETSMVARVVSGSDPPQITYAVQAFNGAGRSRAISKSISCFD